MESLKTNLQSKHVTLKFQWLMGNLPCPVRTCLHEPFCSVILSLKRGLSKAGEEETKNDKISFVEKCQCSITHVKTICT